MEDKRLDDKIKKALMDATDQSLELKDEVWEKIQNRIKDDAKGELNMSNINKKKNNHIKGKIIKITAVAATVLILLGGFTEGGKATFIRIRDMLVPEKLVEEEIEGIKEDTNVTLVNKAEYSIYFDQERYRLEEMDDFDVIRPKIDLGEMYPDVYMKIQQIEDKSPNELIYEIEEALKNDYQIFKAKTQVEEPIKGISVYAQAGYQWNDEVVRYYLVENGKGGAFVIKQQFFVEALEGHGARFDNILKNFIIDTE